MGGGILRGNGWVLLAALGACAPSGGRMAELQADEVQAAGTVQKTSVGINCWRFEAEDGTGYELRPDQAPAEVLVDGRRVVLVLRKRADLASSCMVGQLVDVVRVVPTASQ